MSEERGNRLSVVLIESAGLRRGSKTEWWEITVAKPKPQPQPQQRKTMNVTLLNISLDGA